MSVLDTACTAVGDTFRLSGAALAGGLVVGLACAMIGVHVVARRLVVVGIALPQLAALGIATSLLLAGEGAALVSPLRHDVTALVFEILGVALLAWAARGRSLGQDAIAGTLFVVGAALAPILMTRCAQGLDEVRNQVEGDVLFIGAKQLPRLFAFVGVPILLHAVGGRRLLFCTFDRETAATLGIRTGAWEMVFYGTLAVVVAAGVHAAGTLFVFAFLVLPGASGIVLGRSAAGVMTISVVVGLVAVFVGFVVSYAVENLPTSHTCAAAALALFVVCAAVAWLRDRFATT
jgi:ABC-type Mn2+/Zn2+ transport system permease subunit